MKISILTRLTLPLFLILCCPLLNAVDAGGGKTNLRDRAVSLKDEFGNAAGHVNVQTLIEEIEPPQMEWVFDAENLKKQIAEITDYLENYKQRDPATVHAGIAAKIDNDPSTQPPITLADVKRTLTFVSRTIDEDQKRGRPSRLNDPAFRARHFRVFRWYPVKRVKGEYVRSGDKIRMTRYAVFTVPGSLQKTHRFDCALYALPDDEVNFSLEQAAQRRGQLSRFRYTKPQVLAGAYREGGAAPLVWLTRDGLEEALMEGSICVSLGGGHKRFYNVNRNNGILYDRTLKNPRLQKRYWYFAPVARPRGYGLDVDSQVAIYPGAAFAGDIYNMGLGKLLGMAFTGPKSNRKKCRLAVLADTGGAFTPNLGQLDYYAGVFNRRSQFKRDTRHLPGKAVIYLFIKKENPEKVPK